MTWYDTFSRFYDLALERSYRSPRQASFAALETGLGNVVLDLACGTGQNFPILMERFKDDPPRLLGIDYSPGMLRRAARRTRKGRWKQVQLLEADARTLSGEQLRETLGNRDTADYVVCTLGLSVLPDWETVFGQAFALLEPGGQFLIMDVWAERRVPQTWLVEHMAHADLRRQVWQPLERVSEEFELRYLKGSAHFHGGRLFMATGFKSRNG